MRPEVVSIVDAWIASTCGLAARVRDAENQDLREGEPCGYPVAVVLHDVADAVKALLEVPTSASSPTGDLPAVVVVALEQLAARDASALVAVTELLRVLDRRGAGDNDQIFRVLGALTGRGTVELRGPDGRVLEDLAELPNADVRLCV